MPLYGIIIAIIGGCIVLCIIIIAIWKSNKISKFKQSVDVNVQPKDGMSLEMVITNTDEHYHRPHTHKMSLNSVIKKQMSRDYRHENFQAPPL
jgi:hypothetical protein